MPLLRRTLSVVALAWVVFLPPAHAALTGDPISPGVTRDPAAEDLAYLKTLPETNPYRAALLRLQTLPSPDRDALREWADHASGDENPAPILTARQHALARELSAALVSAAARPPATADDWPPAPDPHDPENPVAIIIPAIGLNRQLARIAVKNADALPPGEAIAAYAAAAQFGRQRRVGGTLIEQLTGVAMESIAFAAAGRRLAEFSPDELKALSAAWSSLHPSPTTAQTFADERDRFFRPIVEKIVRPGLLALLAEEAEAGGDIPTAVETAADPDAGFTRDLRLSALVDLGDGERRISLENVATGVVFTITEGKSAEGIELVTLDFTRHEAIIRQGHREAVIHLETKRIVERRHAADRLRRYFTGSNPTGEADAETDANLLRAVMERARRHPGGADGYADELLAAYQHHIDLQLAAADSPQTSAEPATDQAPASDDPLLKAFLPSFGKIARTFNNSVTSATVFQAAIHHRLKTLGQTDSPGPSDPWSEDGTGFALETTPDGGFLLRSRYEVNPDEPLTYKFAAPDAGFVRPK